MTDARRSRLEIKYNHKTITSALEPYLLSFSYTDNSSAKADDFQINLEDKAGLWTNGWFPNKGDTLTASLITENWNVPGKIVQLPFGLFEIDDISGSGPPNTVAIKAVSVPISTSLRGEKKTRAWEKVRLSIIARDIASNARLTVFFDSPYNPFYDRIEQTEQSDLSFLLKLCEDAGLALKITGNQMIIFDEAKYEQAPPILTIVKDGKLSNGVSVIPCISYSFSVSSTEIYSKARVEYKGMNEKPIIHTFIPKNPPNTGRTLIINERVTSIAEAEILAKKRLRQKNKEEVKFSIPVMGNTSLVSGVTVNLRGWGKLDGKYFAEASTHIGPVYTTQLELRRVLEGY